MIYIGNKEPIPYIGNKAVEYIYIGDKLYYSAIKAHTVTYYVDTSVIYSEDVEEGNTCLSPTTFTPSKSGYTFTGWREDNTANSSVLSSKVMDDEDISLYAVFQKNIILTTYNNSPNATTQTKQQYYNNGNVVNPSFTLTQNTQSGWTPLGWCTSSSATASIAQNNGATITLSSNATYYGKYSTTITLSYNGNGATGGSTAAQTGTRYYNSGNYSNPSFTLRSNGFTRTSYRFTKWAMGSTSGTQYSAGASVTLSANTTFYALWQIVYTTSTAKHVGSGIRVGGDGFRAIGAGSTRDGGTGDSVTTKSLTGNTVSWYYSNNTGTIKANCACTVSIACSFTTTCVDGWTWYSYGAKVYKNNSDTGTWIWNGGEMGGNGQGGKSYSNTVSISLNAGDYCEVRLGGGHDADMGDRTGWYWTITYTATPR